MTGSKGVIEMCEDGTILLIRCPKCGQENYVHNVATGICTWCGYDAHKDKKLTK